MSMAAETGCNSMKPRLLRILLVEPDPLQARRLNARLQEPGRTRFVVEHADSLRGAVAMLAEGNFDLVLLDAALPEATAVEAIVQLQSGAGAVPIAVLTSTDEEALLFTAVRDIEHHVPKEHVNASVILQAIQRATGRVHAREQLAQQARDARLLYSSAVTAAEAGSVEQALKEMLRLICQTIDCPVGHVYLPATDGSEDMIPTDIWHTDDPQHYKAFREATMGARMGPGEGLAGMIRAACQPVWLPSVLDEPRFRRVAACRHIGLQSALGFPIMIGNELFAVLEFFSRRELCRDDELLSVLRGVGEQLGRVVERQRAQAALRQAHAELEARVCERTAQLQEARLAAEAASRAKDHFLAVMSHELRTPLNGVIGMTELLLRSNLDARQRRHAWLAKSAADMLLTLINDILDFSKIEAGKLELEHIDYELHYAIEGVIMVVESQAASKGLSLVCDIHPDVPRRVRGDPGRVQQVLLNLTGNAIKFTESGQVLVRVSRDAEDERRAVTRVSVTDTGVGIPAERLDRMFVPFSQADASTTRRFGGTGLGLAICKRLVNAMGGEIGVISEPGRGSTFWFCLPLEKQGTDDRPPRLLDDLRRVRILAVDGSPEGRSALDEQLTSLDLQHATVGTAHDALNMLQSARLEAAPFGIVIVDRCLPDGSGEQLGAAIRSDPQLQNTALMLMSSEELDDVTGSRTIGFTGWIEKPTTPHSLVDAILETLICAKVTRSREARPRVRTGTVETATRKEGRILLAEDNDISREVAHTILAEAGYQCDVVENGESAVEAVIGGQYSLVLMDCQMPKMDGFQATERIREHEARCGSQHVPIVALTASALKGDRERCLAAGMNDYISKPLDPARFVVLVQSHLERHER
jgi:signal transduction histidine kinase/CheY-like chemotaxis protein